MQSLCSTQPVAGYLIAVTLAAAAFSASAAPKDLIVPTSLVADNHLTPKQVNALTKSAISYDTFWDTGNEALAREALADNFIDKTPPEGRKQGPEGPLLASRTFRTAVPDLTAEVEQMIVTGDRVVSHLHFRGHFTGTFGKIKGHGQTVDFLATDIYQIQNGKIVANWHIEDNLTLLKQLGAL